METPTPRRWPIFSLRTLFCVVTLLAILCGWLVRDYAIVQARLRERRITGFEPDLQNRQWIWRRWMGDRSWVWIRCKQEDLDRLQNLFPEAEVFVDGNPEAMTLEEFMSSAPRRRTPSDLTDPIYPSTRQTEDQP